jgi:hypothetical protein
MAPARVSPTLNPVPHQPGESLVLSWARNGAVSAGILGGVVGLVVGLHAYPATAWFAVMEVGLPASILGALLGLTAGAIALAARRLHPTRPPQPH